MTLLWHDLQVLFEQHNTKSEDSVAAFLQLLEPQELRTKNEEMTYQEFVADYEAPKYPVNTHTHTHTHTQPHTHICWSFSRRRPLCKGICRG